MSETYFWERLEHLAALSPEQSHGATCRCPECIDDLFDPREDAR